MQFLIIAVFLAIAAATNGQTISQGRCPLNIKVESDFQIDQYVGNWYEIHRYETAEEIDGDCGKVKYTPRADNSIQIINSMVVSGKNVTVEGNGFIAPNSNGTGKLLVNFPFAGDNLYDYWVLTTDYSSYSFVYQCVNLPNNMRAILSWILSRKPTLSPPAVLAIDPFMQPENGLAWSNYRETIHSTEACEIRN